MSETLTTNQAQEVAQNLVERLLSKPAQAQGRLFEVNADEENRRWREHCRAQLLSHHPDKLVLEANLVNEFRYMAAMYGAGFHPTQFEEISFTTEDTSGMEIGVGYLGEVYIQRIPEKRERSNRMRDEVNEELFTLHVPTTEYDLSSGMYITTAEDLQKIFEFDYCNLEVCRALNFDLLYERKN